MRSNDFVILYHTGMEKIERPDIYHGRKNADLGQGFYLSDDRDFVCRWAKTGQDQPAVINIYRLDLAGLKIRAFGRDEEWLSYVSANRHGRPDLHNDHDVVTGPIANDTIYDTFGLLTSGVLEKDLALRSLRIG